MKKLELKKLAAKFSEFLAESGNGNSNIKSVMSEFWFATFACNNTEREAELLEYWKAN